MKIIQSNTNTTKVISMKNNIILLFAAMSIFTACEKKKPETKDDKFVLSDTMYNMIKIDSAQIGNMDDEITLSGEVNFNENHVIKIFPRSSGQVVESKVSLGDYVKKGQVLAIVKSADIAGNYSDLNSANADLAIAKRQMESTESLYKNGISSEQEYTAAKQNYQKAVAAKAKIASTLQINGGVKSTAGGQYELTAPIDGYIVEKKINSGDYIRSDNADALFTISDLKNVWIYANVYETDIPKVKEGYAVEIKPMAYPNMTLEGKVDQISQVLDPETKAMRVRVVLDNSKMLLKPDMFAKVIVNHQEAEKSVYVPSTAVLSQDGKNYVVIYNSRSDMKISEITIARKVGDKTYITSGINQGQKVITQNQLFIFNQLLNE